MNKQKFVDFIRKPKTLSSSDLEEIKGIIEEYPYFQNARAILAKGSKLHKLPDADKRIANASVYAPDRAFLKKYLTDEIIFLRPLKVIESVSEKENVAEPKSVKPEIGSAKPQHLKESPKIDLKEERPVDITPPPPKVEKTEPITVNKSQPAPAAAPARETAAEPKKPPVQPVTKKEPEELKLEAPEANKIDDLIAELQKDIEEMHKSKARFLEIEKRIEEEDAVEKAIKKADARPEKKTKEAATEKKKSQKKEAKGEANIPDKNIKAAIVEEFLEKKPSMPINSPGTEIEKSTSDLSAESGKFNPEVASEYLAEIFIEQGRKDRAIEIYKTLILKFPDKSIYFADLIKKLDS